MKKPLSPIGRQLHRFKLHHASALAMASAVKDAVRLVAGPERRRLATNARRQEACAMSFRIRIVNKPGEPTRLCIRNPRSCHQPTCMLCARLRSSKLRKQFNGVLAAAVKAAPTAPFLMITLTLRNYAWTELPRMLDDLANAEARLFKMQPMKQAFLGRITSFEIVCRGTREAPEAGAHIHILVQAQPQYFSRAHTYYVNQAELTRLFQEAARVDYAPIVHVMRVRAADGAMAGADHSAPIRELLKYCLKPAEFFERAPEQPDGTINMVADTALVAVLTKALYRRRMLRVSGTLAKAAKIFRKQQKEVDDLAA